MKNTKIKISVAIIGFGRFGKTLYRLIKNDFAITIYDRTGLLNSIAGLNKDTKITKSLDDVYNCSVIFFCVPITLFEQIITKHKKYFRNQLLIDVLSVKIHAAKVFKKYLSGTKTRALLTHPMFGPDSSRNGFSGLPIVLNKFTSNVKEYEWWKKYFTRKKLRVVELTPQKHDRLAANSQAVAHLVGRLLDDIGFVETQIDTMGAKKLREMQNQVGHNSWELFIGLQNYNPYARIMRRKFGSAYKRLCKKLAATKID